MNKSTFRLLMKTSWLFSLLIGLSSQSLFFSWACFELNVLTFMPLIKKMNHSSSNSLMKYFIIQSISSSLFLMALLIRGYFSTDSVIFILFLMSMWIKLGFFPFSSWYFQMAENLEWEMWFYLNTLQKLLPFWIMISILPSSSTLLSMLWLNNLYCIIEIWNQSSLRWMINCSSLNHFSWMLLSSLSEKQNNWEAYFVVYTLLSLMLLAWACHSPVHSLLNSTKTKLETKLMMFFIMLNFMGMPPMVGFLPKLMILKDSEHMISCLFLLISMMPVALSYIYFCISSLSVNLLSKTPASSPKWGALASLTSVISAPLILMM